MAKQFTVSRRETIAGMMRAPPQATQGFHLPAPLGGLNTVDGLSLMPPNDCVRLNNMMPTRYGLESRPGTINKCILIGNSTSTEVRTVMPFNDVNRDATLARDRLFAVTDQGIYDVTTSTSNPTLMGIYDAANPNTLLSTGWGTKGSVAGWCSFVNFSTAAEAGGSHYLCVCDLLNGYHYYDPDGGGAGIGRWFKVKQGNSGPGAMEGVDPTTLVQICAWKGRLLFSQANNSRAWYLTPGTITGTGAAKPVAIDMGSRFTAGGFLKGLYTWTVDGGAGIDDFLVAISSGGDVIVWEGISPADANFQIKGAWYLGEMPIGRRIADTFGGDLMILSSSGLIALSQIVQGLNVTDDAYATHKVASLIRDRLRVFGREFGWSVSFHPSYSCVVINQPYDSVEERYNQLVYNTQQNGWANLSGIPARSWAAWQGKEWIGTDDGRVLQWTGPVDTKPVAAGSSTYEEAPINFYLLTAFSDYGAPGRWKRIQFVRPIFVTPSLPKYSASVQYDFNLEIPQSPDTPVVQLGAKWDQALWDQAEWGAGLVTTQPTIGARGIGRFAAIALAGYSTKTLALVGFDVMGDVGGLL